MENAIATLNKLAKELIQNNQKAEKRIAELENKLQCLFEEEEIKELPSFKLLKNIYCNPDRDQEITKKQNNYNDIPSIYQPPTEVKKTIKKIQIQKKQTAKVSAKTAPAPAAEVAPASASEFDVCMLDTESPTPTPTPSPISVYKCEISGQTYLYNDNKFYNSKDGSYVGKVDEGVLLINGQPVTLNEVKLIRKTISGQNYLTDADDSLYIMCNNHVARLAGEIKDNNAYFFS